MPASLSASMPLSTLAPLGTAAAPASSLRRAGAEDAAALSAFFQGLNAQNRRLRFHGACKGASLALAVRLCGAMASRSTRSPAPTPCA